MQRSITQDLCMYLNQWYKSKRYITKKEWKKYRNEETKGESKTRNYTNR